MKLLIHVASLWVAVQSITIHIDESPTFLQSNKLNKPQSTQMLQKLALTGLCKQDLQRVLNIENINEINTNSKHHRANLMQTAVCFHSHNKIEEAMTLYTYLRDQFPNFAFPLVNIAFIELKKGNPHNVIRYLHTYFEEVGGMYGNETNNYDRMTDIDAQIIGSPCQPFALHSLECVNALNFYGIAHVETYDYDKTLESYQRAIEIGREDVSFVTDVYQNLGDLYNTMGLFEYAVKAYLEAFWSSIKFHGVHNLNPTPLIQRALLVPGVQSSLSTSIDFVQKFERRIDDLMKLIDYGGEGWENDDSDLFMVAHGFSQMEDIRSLPPLVGMYNSLDKRIQIPHFYFHYYGFHDKPIQEKVMYMIERISHPASLNLNAMTNHNYPSIASYDVAPIIPTNYSPNIDNTRSKLRIVFISSHFGGNEPHGLLMIDVLKRLPSDIFECIAIGTGTKAPSKAFVDALDGNYHGIGSNDRSARELMSSLTPDCVVFGEVMNDGTLFTLAQTRFAPIQVLVMGAPVTSGFSNTIDYFISGDRLEHPFRTQMSGDQSSKEHYTEQVVLFDGQAISFPSSEPHPAQSSLLARGDAAESFSAYMISSIYDEPHSYDNVTGMPTDVNGPIYLCFQNIFKIHPAFDSILIKILQIDQEGHIVLQASRNYHKTLIVLDRIRDTVVYDVCPEVRKICKDAKSILERIHFIPRVESDRMIFIFQQASVMLHPFPFGGSKTASDALKAGIPLVTYPQAYLRGRLASTFYTTMALHEIDMDIASSKCCVATDEIDYIQKALKLGRDKTYRQKVSNAIQKRNHRIFDDIQTSFEWARFLTRSLGVVIDDDELALKMKYHPKPWQEDSFVQDAFIKMQQRWKRSMMIKKNYL